MEQLEHDEADIQSQIAAYQSQVSLVEQQLSADGADRESLEELLENLRQLIQLTEESLLEVKKQKLLLMMHGGPGENTGEAEKSAPESKPEVQVDEDDALHGLKCSAPLREAWGAVSYHNAMIMCKEGGSEGMHESAEEDFKVRVLFTQPLYPAMKACSFFLEGSCKFTEESCKFSHGHVVMFSELQPYQEPDYELARVGGSCLAKHTDDLWYPAVISSLGETMEIHFNTLNVTAQLELEHVIPQDDSSDESGVSSDSSDDSDSVRVVEGWPLSSGPNQPLGDWEKYTKGVGSKLLSKMGYIHGQGLGKSGQGRLTPVEITILPAGKSLDACAEIRERKEQQKGTGKRKRKKKIKKVTKEEEESKEPTDMFQFLNTRIFKKEEAPSQLQMAKEKYGTSSTGKGNENLNVKLFKLQEDIKLMQKRRHSLREALHRHRGKNKAMESHVTDKLTQTDKELAQLVREEQCLLKKISSKSEHKKLSVF